MEVHVYYCCLFIIDQTLWIISWFGSWLRYTLSLITILFAWHRITIFGFVWNFKQCKFIAPENIHTSGGSRGGAQGAWAPTLYLGQEKNSRESTPCNQGSADEWTPTYQKVWMCHCIHLLSCMFQLYSRELVVRGTQRRFPSKCFKTCSRLSRVLKRSKNAFWVVL